MEDTKKTYEAIFDVTMPGQTRSTSYKIIVHENDLVAATKTALLEWQTRTEPKDVRVKEITKIQVA